MYRVRKKSVRRAFTIPEDIADLFDNVAENRDMYPSALMVQLLKRWLLFDQPLQKIGTVTIPLTCFQLLVEKISSDGLEELAKEQSNRNFALILSLFDGQPNLDSVIESYYQRFGKYSGRYSFKREQTENGRIRLVFQHVNGLKWSRYISSYNHAILEKLCNKIDCVVEDKVVIFDLVPKQNSLLRNPQTAELI